MILPTILMMRGLVVCGECVSLGQTWPMAGLAYGTLNSSYRSHTLPLEVPGAVEATVHVILLGQDGRPTRLYLLPDGDRLFELRDRGAQLAVPCYR